MSQPDPNAQPTKTNASAGKPSDPKAGAKAQPASGNLSSVWYVILFLIVAAVFAGYRSQESAEEHRPVVSAAEVEDNVVVEPEAADGSSSTGPALVITSDVRGADVYLNGNRVGKTPHKATPLAPGNYDVKVVHEGYETFEEQVQVQTQDDSIHAALRPMGAENNTPEKTAATAAPVDIRGLGESVAVKHKHRIGSCEGVLRSEGEGLRFETDHKDAFFAAYADVEELSLDESKLTLKVRNGRKYDFTEQNDDPEALLAFHERVGEALPGTESADK
jgi:hypothetical protein